MTTVVTALFPDLRAVEACLDRLAEAGFPRKTISVIAADTPHHAELVAAETADVPRGVLTGAVTGGLLASLAFGALTLSGVGLLVAGPLVIALTAGAGGAVAGGVIGALTGFGVSSMAAQDYETEIQNGRVLVAVHTTHDHRKQAQAVLARCGATHMSDCVHRAHGGVAEATP